MQNLDQLFIFLILDSIDLNLHFIEERADLVLQVDAVLFVRVKTNKNPLTRMDHVEVVVTDLFIMLVVALMGKLVRFDAKKGVADEFTVIIADEFFVAWFCYCYVFCEKIPSIH